MSVNLRHLALVTACLTGFVDAANISEIRFGKTEQRSRLVIESDTRLSAGMEWTSKYLVLELTDIEEKPSNEIITLSALSIISSIKWNEKDKILRLSLPIRRQDFIQEFRLAAQGGVPERLALDWRTDKTDASVGLVIEKPRLQAISAKTTISSGIKIPSSSETILLDAKNALTDKNYRLAISLLSQLLKQGTNQQQAFSLEYLGVARERNNQYAFAKQYYQRFIQEYPNSDNLARVRQRLAALIGVQNIGNKRKLNKSKRKSIRNRSAVRGSISTDYRQSVLVNDLGESRQTLSLLGLDVDVRGNFDESGVKFRFSGSHFEDLTKEGGSTNDRLRYANVGWESVGREYQIDIGRQRSRGKGIFGRFDGAVFGYAINETNKINLTIGAPVSSSKVLKLDPERSFIGLNYEWDEMIADVDLSVFFLNQTIGGLTDRRAIGGEVKYVNSGTSVYSLVDYDIFHSELNALLLSVSHTTKGKTRYHGSYNQRKSPYISTRNALIGQSADSVEELQDLLLTDDEILDLAADRTLQSETATFQISTPINKTFDISGSITQLSISGAPASGGVAEIVAPGSQTYFNTYISASKLYSGSDTSQLGYRMSKLSNSDVNSVYISSRYRWKNAFSLAIKFRYDDRQNDNGGGQQNISPSLRVQYQNKTQFFYADIGAIMFTNQVQNFEDIKTDIYYSYIGYRYFF